MKPPPTALLLYGMPVILLAVATTTTTIGGVYAQIPTTPPQIPTMPPTNQTTLETNATTTAATNATAQVTAPPPSTAATAPTTAVITQLIGVRGEVIPLSAQNIQFQQQDPIFAKLVQVINDCMNFVVAQDQEGRIDQLDNNRKFLCDSVISQGVEQFCGYSATLDILKCDEANQMNLHYMLTAGAAGFSA
jgi:hypothetical protein